MENNKLHPMVKYRCSTCLYKSVHYSRPPCDTCTGMTSSGDKGNWTPIRELDKILFCSEQDRDAIDVDRD